MVITTVISDDHALSSLGLQHMLEATGEFTCLARAASGIEAISLVRQHKPQLAVLDFAMPGANGLEAHIEIKRWSPDTRTAIVTAKSDPRLLQTFLEQGVDGVFQKSQRADLLLDGLRAVARGEQVFQPSISDAPDSMEKTTLSARELEVLFKVAEGLSVKAIAEAMNLSPKTVETHKASLMRKMGVNSTASLIVAAVKDKLIDVG